VISHPTGFNQRSHRLFGGNQNLESQGIWVWLTLLARAQTRPSKTTTTTREAIRKYPSGIESRLDSGKLRRIDFHWVRDPFKRNDYFVSG